MVLFWGRGAEPLSTFDRRAFPGRPYDLGPDGHSSAPAETVWRCVVWARCGPRAPHASVQRSKEVMPQFLPTYAGETWPPWCTREGHRSVHYNLRWGGQYKCNFTRSAPGPSPGPARAVARALAHARAWPGPPGPGPGPGLAPARVRARAGAPGPGRGPK